MTRAIGSRVARLEEQRNHRARPSYVVSWPAEEGEDGAALHAAIEAHRSATGYDGPVILAPPEMTEARWLACCGRAEAA